MNQGRTGTVERRWGSLAQTSRALLAYLVEAVACGVVAWFATLTFGGILILLHTAVAVGACVLVSGAAVTATVAALLRHRRLEGFALGIVVGTVTASGFFIFVLVPFTQSMSTF